MTLLASSLVALLSSPLSLPPSALSPSPHPPLTIPCPYPSAEAENTRFCVLEKKNGFRTDGPTDRLTDRPTDIATYRAAIAAKNEWAFFGLRSGSKTFLRPTYVDN